MQAPVFLTNLNSFGLTDLLVFELMLLVVEILEIVKLLLRDLGLLWLKSETDLIYYYKWAILTNYPQESKVSKKI